MNSGSGRNQSFDNHIFFHVFQSVEFFLFSSTEDPIFHSGPIKKTDNQCFGVRLKSSRLFLWLFYKGPASLWRINMLRQGANFSECHRLYLHNFLIYKLSLKNCIVLCQARVAFWPILWSSPAYSTYSTFFSFTRQKNYSIFFHFFEDLKLRLNYILSWYESICS